MTIDEAIENLKYDIEIDMYIHDIAPQLAEWFEELKMYREAERTLDNAYNNGYNKAIDDFSNEIDKYIERYDGTIYDEAYYPNVKSDFEKLKKIGNQLKEGGKE